MVGPIPPSMLGMSGTCYCVSRRICIRRQGGPASASSLCESPARRKQRRQSAPTSAFPAPSPPATALPLLAALVAKHLQFWSLGEHEAFSEGGCLRSLEGGGLGPNRLEGNNLERGM